MRARVTQLESELSIVNWYLETMEEGVDSKEIVKEYSYLKKKLKKMEYETSKKIKKLESSLKKFKGDLKSAL